MATSVKSREIKVFVSSTFRDMHAEREELVKRVFPRLRKLCASLGVTWTEVDLRWGITDEQKAEGKVLPLCLEEIRRCRPFFIGILGERYGWVPGEIPSDLRERHPWIREYGGCSVTELEIVHGVLNDPGMRGHAYFYFRDPGMVERLRPGVERADFLAESPAARRKLAGLKDRLRRAHAGQACRLRENFRDSEELGRWVLEDFTALINLLFPAHERHDLLDRQAAAHEAFARSRTEVYIGRKEYFDRLDTHAGGSSPPLVVLGASGSGKSALLANWALAYREAHPDELMILHFIGGAPDSADASGIARRIMLEFRRRFAWPEDVPVQRERIGEEFPVWISRAAGQGRIILVLDGLDQLEDRENAPDLAWLPDVLPPNVRLLLSTLPGRSLDALARRGLPRIFVEPLTPDERGRLISDFLGQYRKQLSPARIRRLADAPAGANPLYLRTLLDELRQFGSHERLDIRIEYYLEARTPGELFRRVVDRWREDYSGEHDIVRRGLAFLWAARRGLSEAELADMLGRSGLPLQRALLTPWLLATEVSLANRSGLLTFFHAYLREAVRESLLPTAESRRDAHCCVALYFAAMPEWTERKLEELPWQWQGAQAWTQLHDCLTDLEFFVRLFDQDGYELLQYWLHLPEGHDMEKSYEEAWRRWTAGPELGPHASTAASLLAAFLHQAARYEAAEAFSRRAIEIDEKDRGPDHPMVARDLANLAECLRALNRHAEAEPLYRRALAMATRGVATGADRPSLATIMGNLALLLSETGRLDEAEILFRQALALHEECHGTDHPAVAADLHNLSLVLKADGRAAEAKALLHRALDITERTLGPRHPAMANRTNTMAELLKQEGRLEEAEVMYRRALTMAEEGFGPDHPQVAVVRNNLAVLLRDMGRSEK